MRILFLILILLLPVNVFGAIVLGTNCGFVTEAPVGDPQGLEESADNRASALQHTLPADATTITEIGFYITTQGDDQPNWEVGIYDDGGSDYPSDAIGRDQTNVLPTGNAKWVSVTGLSIPVSSHQNTLLWIAIQIDNVSPAVRSDVGGAASGVSDVITSQTTLNDPYTDSSPASSARTRSIYAVYTTDGAPSAPQNRGYIIGLLSLNDWKEMMGV